MRFEYEYSIEDVREINRLAHKYPPRGRPSSTTATIQWVVLIAMAMALSFMLGMSSALGNGKSLPMDMPKLASICVPWLLCLYMLYHFAIKSRWPNTMTLKKHSSFQRPFFLELSESGIFSSDGASETRLPWSAFDKLIATDLTFAIRLANSSQWLLLPKRAILNQTEVDQVSQLFHTRVSQSTGAFPVVSVTESMHPKEPNAGQ